MNINRITKFGDSLLGCFRQSSKSKAFGSNATQGEEVSTICSKFQVFSYKELKAATKGFAHKIGQGGFGSVYKGQLVGGDYVAVKVLTVEQESQRGEGEFISETTALLSEIKHENIITLRGCCINGAHRYLVYDFMENSSLNHAFLGDDQKRMKFNWTLRKKVSLGIAKGLRYLHQEIRPHHIVHRDIKASNILLDRYFVPKIADFGLAKLFRTDVSRVTTRVAGTFFLNAGRGYLSPEYAHSGYLSRKSDVYSFGVLLLEIVSGTPVVDYHMKYGEKFVVEKAWEHYKSKNLAEMVDFVIEEDHSEEAIRFLKVGLLCVQETTKLRPTMSIVVQMLTGEIDTENVEISWPGIVADLMEVKI